MTRVIVPEGWFALGPVPDYFMRRSFNSQKLTAALAFHPAFSGAARA